MSLHAVSLKECCEGHDTHTHTTLNLERRPSMDDAFLPQSDRLKQMTRFD